MQRVDILITSNKEDYIEQLMAVIDDNVKHAPVLIVAGDTYPVIENGLSKRHYDFVSLNKNKAEVIEAVLLGRYLLKNEARNYGIYLLNEA